MGQSLTTNWMVATALMHDAAGDLLLVENRRRNGRHDWTPPGGVVDAGESVLEALSREVVEETGLQVHTWSPLAYTIDVTFVERPMTLHVEAYLATAWDGEVAIDDPDGIVQQAIFADSPKASSLLEASAPWVRDPLSEWLATTSPARHEYLVGGPGADAAGVVSYHRGLLTQ